FAPSSLLSVLVASFFLFFFFFFFFFFLFLFLPSGARSARKRPLGENPDAGTSGKLPRNQAGNFASCFGPCVRDELPAAPYQGAGGGRSTARIPNGSRGTRMAANAKPVALFRCPHRQVSA
ncbi:hypothetical protein ACUXMK_005525, partial [Burkholderia sp. 140710038-1]